MQQKKVSYTLPYKEATFSKLKYFLIISNKALFLYIIFFSIFNQFIFFHLLRDFCNVHDYIVAFFRFLL